MNPLEIPAVILMAHGSPASLAEIPAYLTSLRGGRPVDEAAVADMRARYAAIGGHSPMLEITFAQAEALQADLRRRTGDGRWRVFVGTRYWNPTLQEALTQVIGEGFRSVLGICMVPHPARMTVHAYTEKLAIARASLGAEIELRVLPPWESQPRYLDALEETLRNALGRVARDSGLLFSAHSLPLSALPPDDDYTARLEKTASILAGRLGLPDSAWQVCFQCAPAKNGSWLGPYLDDSIAALSGKAKTVVADPLGFVSDHLEVLYDLDIEARRQTESLGLEFLRVPSLNTHPLLIEALAGAVLEEVPHFKGISTL